MLDKQLFGSRLKELRKQKKMSQTELGRLLGITATQIGDMEKGDSATSMARLYELCEYFEVSADYFMGLTDDPRPYLRSAPTAAKLQGWPESSDRTSG